MQGTDLLLPFKLFMGNLGLSVRTLNGLKQMRSLKTTPVTAVLYECDPKSL
jgi:hypothetical protein